MQDASAPPVRRLESTVVYGPVHSRRFGSSLGINLSGSGKFCSFNCPYCFRGFNDGRPDREAYAEGIPAATEVAPAIEAAMADWSPGAVDDWSFAGNAEPTDHPEFPAIADQVVALRNRRWPDIKISVLTNGMNLIPRVNRDHAAVAAALRKVDRPCLKLDGGTPSTWRLMAAPAFGATLEEWLAGAEALPGAILQIMGVQGRIDNTTDDALAALARCISRLRPREIDLYSINKTPADSRLKAVSPTRLAQVRDTLVGLLNGGEVAVEIHLDPDPGEG